ncbi:potassium channel family protein [Streptomyces sp. NPDC000594]|uniref:potassium channel family protein n=1 Tax=Streptomyces sp. NPDC000594 TaxID=3154261 RepID=UPI00332D7F02
MDEESRLWRWRRRTEVPLFVASGLFLGCYAVRVLAHGLGPGWKDLLLAVTYGTWALFVIDYAVRWRLSGEGAAFLHRHPMDALVVLLPLLRPLRIVQLYETVHRRRAEARLSLYARVIAYAGISALLLGFAGALTVYSAERGAPGATIKDFGDSVWWACSTLTTVGYGDVTPVTALGRTVAVGMMAGGMALLGAVTGSFSSWLIQTFTLDEDTGPPGRTPGAP